MKVKLFILIKFLIFHSYSYSSSTMLTAYKPGFNLRSLSTSSKIFLRLAKI